MTKRRQAVLLIHGIGDQHPMDTVREFANAVTKGSLPGPGILNDPNDPAILSYPDDHAETFEMRRLMRYVDGNRTDFYEFYWAHLVPQAQWGRIGGWYWILMKRSVSDVPPRLKVLWWLSWIGFIALLAAGLGGVWTYFQDGEPAKKAALPLLVTFAAGLVGTRFQKVVGDAAIYLLPKPSNVEARQKIRREGVAFLETLNKDYDRVIVVGHSLGSIIGYDILKFAWERSHRAFKPRLSRNERLQSDRTILEANTLAAAADNIGTQPFVTKWSEMTRRLWSDYQVDGLGWKVSDFVTIGSPLTYADLLLAESATDFEDRIDREEMLVSPPTQRHGSFLTPVIAGEPYVPSFINRSSLFAVTRWVNIFSPTRWVFKGDFLSGPVAPLFGRGVGDVAVDEVSHSAYWTEEEGNAVVAEIRKALDLECKSFPT